MSGATTPTEADQATPRRIRAVDVAREAGVSRAAVGFVINNTPGITISEATRARVLAAADKLGYRPNVAASALARGRSNIVLLVLPDWPLDHMLGRHIAEAERVLEEAGLHLVTTTKHPSSVAKPLWEVLAADVVIGMVPFSDEELAALRAAGVSRIFPDRSMTVTDNPAFVIGPRLQVQYLTSKGHKRLAYVGSADTHLANLTEVRLSEATSEAAAQGASLVDSIVADIDSDLAETIADWRRDDVSAVVAYNDEIAAVVLRGARRANVTVPDELAVIGHDDTPLARLVFPPLTSVSYDVAGLGNLFAALASGELDGDLDFAAVIPSPTVVSRSSA